MSEAIGNGKFVKINQDLCDIADLKGRPRITVEHIQDTSADPVAITNEFARLQKAGALKNSSIEFKDSEVYESIVLKGFRSNAALKNIFENLLKASPDAKVVSFISNPSFKFADFLEATTDVKADLRYITRADVPLSAAKQQGEQVSLRLTKRRDAFSVYVNNERLDSDVDPQALATVLVERSFNSGFIIPAEFKDFITEKLRNYDIADIRVKWENANEKNRLNLTIDESKDKSSSKPSHKVVLDSPITIEKLLSNAYVNEKHLVSIKVDHPAVDLDKIRRLRNLREITIKRGIFSQQVIDSLIADVENHGIKIDINIPVAATTKGAFKGGYIKIIGASESYHQDGGPIGPVREYEIALCDNYGQSYVMASGVDFKTVVQKFNSSAESKYGLNFKVDQSVQKQFPETPAPKVSLTERLGEWIRSPKGVISGLLGSAKRTAEANPAPVATTELPKVEPKKSSVIAAVTAQPNTMPVVKPKEAVKAAEEATKEPEENKSLKLADIIKLPAKAAEPTVPASVLAADEPQKPAVASEENAKPDFKDNFYNQLASTKAGKYVAGGLLLLTSVGGFLVGNIKGVKDGVEHERNKSAKAIAEAQAVKAESVKSVNGVRREAVISTLSTTAITLEEEFTKALENDGKITPEETKEITKNVKVLGLQRASSYINELKEEESRKEAATGKSK